MIFTMKEIFDLSGAWKYRAEDGSRGEFHIPGSACENSVGEKREYYDEFSADAVRAPREKYEYIGRLCLTRRIEIPPDCADRPLRLFLERVNIASELWIDGAAISRKTVALSTPHTYDFTLSQGSHEIALYIDNRDLVGLDRMASGYSVDTQGYWNGIIGRVELWRLSPVRLENVQVYPAADRITVRAVEVSRTYSPEEQTEAEIVLSVIDPNGQSLGKKRFFRKLFNSRQPDYFEYEIPSPVYWDEFNPALCELRMSLYTDGRLADETAVKFGMRTIRSEGRRLLLNGRQLSLRGTTDCAQFPLTGYPPTDKAFWTRRFEIVKSYGLNYVRFHAWCPPEAAFSAADEAGVYLSVEMPLWLNRDVCALEFGEDPAHLEYFSAEAARISDAYGNHPSFIMFSNGNENMGAFDLLERITIQTKAYDSRRLYTVTSNFDHPVLPCEDYFCAFDANGNHVRIQNMHDTAAESTAFDYSKAVGEMGVPIISFEVGQYCTYPNVDIISRYTGNILPVNFDVIKKSMKRHGVYDRLADYIKASGDLQIKLYKEDIEAALRTRNFGGINLLSLSDYTGQSTAAVGILDAFYESKGLITPEKWRSFCSEVVPLFKARRIFKSSETLHAELDLYDFGEIKTECPIYQTRIRSGGELFFSSDSEEARLQVPLCGISRPSLLTVSVTVSGHTNSWRIFVFPDEPDLKPPRIIRTRAELSEIKRNGGKAIVTRELFDNPKDGSFIPVFWSPVHFPTPKPLGAIIDAEHEIFKHFPTERYPDYQWKTLLEHSVTAALPKDAEPIIEIVPNFVDNTPASPLFEIQSGRATLLYCGFDLNADDAPARCLRNAIYEYMKGDNKNAV